MTSLRPMPPNAIVISSGREYERMIRLLREARTAIINHHEVHGPFSGDMSPEQLALGKVYQKIDTFLTDHDRAVR